MNPYEFLELSLKRERMFPTWMKTFFHGETYFEVNCEHPKVKYLNLIATDRSCASDVVQVLLWQRSYVPGLGWDFSILYTLLKCWGQNSRVPFLVLKNSKRCGIFYDKEVNFIGS